LIVVTGAAGFIGSVLIESLNYNGIDHIIAVDAATKNNHPNLKKLAISSFVSREIFISILVLVPILPKPT
jgi:ADP-L-glycero-D-manno-heptose 6-epimerase